MRYFIRKTTRTENFPYSGPSCEKAGVPEGKWYTDKSEAERDAKKLSKVNIVGFEVIEDGSDS
jgi:hypothetical protein